MIKLENISFSYNNNSQPLHFNIDITANEKVAIIGPSGAGKSTLLHLIAGFATPQKQGALIGAVMLNGHNHTHTTPHKRPVSILFQDNNLFNHLSVYQNIALGIAPNLKITPQQHEEIKAIANKVGLQDYLSRLPAELSGGQQQRVALARCLLRNQPILLLDEPFSSLDKDLRTEMLQLLITLCDEKNITLVMVTHQPEEVEGVVDRVIPLPQS